MHIIIRTADCTIGVCEIDSDDDSDDDDDFTICPEGCQAVSCTQIQNSKNKNFCGPANNAVEDICNGLANPTHDVVDCEKRVVTNCKTDVCELDEDENGFACPSGWFLNHFFCSIFQSFFFVHFSIIFFLFIFQSFVFVHFSIIFFWFIFQSFIFPQFFFGFFC